VPPHIDEVHGVLAKCCDNRAREQHVLKGEEDEDRWTLAHHRLDLSTRDESTRDENDPKKRLGKEREWRGNRLGMG
jgi:hypothetical protein